MTKGSDLAAAMAPHIRAIDLATGELSAVAAEVGGLVEPPPPAPPVPSLFAPGLDEATTENTGLDLSTFDPERILPSQVITKSGTIIRDSVVDGTITVMAGVKDWHLENLEVTGGAIIPNAPRGVIDCRAKGTRGGYLHRVHVMPRVFSYRWAQAVAGHDFTTELCLLEGCADAWGFIAPAGERHRVRDIGSYGGRLAFFANDPEHSDGSHCDVAQAHSGAFWDVDFYGTTMDACLHPDIPHPASAVAMSAVLANIGTTSAVRDVTFRRVVAKGGPKALFNFGSTANGVVEILDSTLDVATTAWKAGILAKTTLNVVTERNLTPDGADANLVRKS